MEGRPYSRIPTRNTNAQPQPVIISPNQTSIPVAIISGGGGGTQYTDAASTPSHPIGTMPVFDNAGTISKVSNTIGLPVAIVGTPSVNATLSAETTKVIGTVNIAAGQVVGLSAGSQVIGHVVVDSGSITVNTISGFALESGGNLDAIEIDIDTLAGGVSGTLFQNNISQFGGTNVTIGQQLAAASLPVILPSATITTLTPPSNTGYALDSSLSTIDTDLKSNITLHAGANVIGHVITDSGSVVNATLSAETTKVIGTINIAAAQTVATVTTVGTLTTITNAVLTNADASIGAGTAPAKALIAGAVYNSTDISPTNGQTFALQADVKGALNIATLGRVSANNSSTATLTAGAVFTGTSDEVRNFAVVQVSVFADQVSATDGLSIQQSQDNVNWDSTDTYTIPASTGKTFSVQIAARYFRIVYTNGGVNQGAFRLQSVFHTMAPKGSSQRPQDALSNENDFEEVWSVNSFYNGTTWDRAKTAPGVTGSLSIGGPTASGSSLVVAPVTMGGLAKTSLPTAVADGQVVNEMTDKFGRQVVLPVTIRDLTGTQTTTISGSTSETTIVSQAASVFNDLLLLVLSNTSATATRVDFRDTTGGSILFSLYAPAADTRGFSLGGVAIPQTSVNTNWTAQCSTGVVDLRVYAVFAKNK